MSNEWYPSACAASKSWSSTSTNSPFEISYALTISSSSTGLPVFFEIFWYPIGELSLRWSSEKWSLCSDTAENIFTGIETSPNEIVPDQMARGMQAFCPPPPRCYPVPFGQAGPLGGARRELEHRPRPAARRHAPR